ncbi:MAG: hypothetical protein J3K34DRAFT_442382 [Monoraphidium minutum]|nr:MAG: hypothetical protein J3K34DRAFT_442382 [Monoraphidium minutum]
MPRSAPQAFIARDLRSSGGHNARACQPCTNGMHWLSLALKFLQTPRMPPASTQSTRTRVAHELAPVCVLSHLAPVCGQFAPAPPPPQQGTPGGPEIAVSAAAFCPATVHGLSPPRLPAGFSDAPTSLLVVRALCIPGGFRPFQHSTLCLWIIKPPSRRKRYEFACAFAPAPPPARAHWRTTYARGNICTWSRPDPVTQVIF